MFARGPRFGEGDARAAFYNKMRPFEINLFHRVIHILIQFYSRCPLLSEENIIFEGRKNTDVDSVHI